MNIVPKTQTGTVGIAPATQGFWDAGSGDFAGQQMAPDQEFSELVEVDTSRGGGSRAAMYLLLGLAAVIVGWFAFETFVAERDPIATLTGYYEQFMGHSEPEPVLAPEGPVKQPATAKTKPTQPEPTPPAKDAVQGNPYWTLPNKILGDQRPLKRAWAPEEEETLRAGLAHHFAFQRYKTVQEVRARRLLGSDAVLWDALQDKKFWTRMFAAVGLAEFNVEISLQSLEGAMNGARSELIADFFERFQSRPSPAALFVMRQMVRLMDEKGRLVVLKGIERSHDSLRDLYLVAATQDSGPRVQVWATKALARKRVTQPKFDELLAVVNGTTDGSYLLTGGRARSVAPAPKLPPSVATDADLEQELKQFQTAEGDVEFYDGEAPADPEQSAVGGGEDPDTFDYEDENVE